MLSRRQDAFRPSGLLNHFVFVEPNLAWGGWLSSAGHFSRRPIEEVLPSMITKFGVALSLAVMFASPCLAQGSASQKFLKEGIEGNFAEIQMGQLAKKQANSDGVRSYGEMLEKDHAAANQSGTLGALSGIPGRGNLSFTGAETRPWCYKQA
jgi:hypothetical protein